MRGCFVWLALALYVVPTPANAQESLSVNAGFDGSVWLNADATLEFTLSRALAPEEGTLAVLVGALDVSPMLATTGTRVTYEPRLSGLPKGESEVVVYVVRADDNWEELARFPLRVLSAGGFEKAELVPRLTLNNKGQVAEGHEPAANRPARAEFQDFSMNAGFQTMHVANGWQVQTQSNYMGVSNRQEALRFGERQNKAPLVDLSDYSITVERGAARLAAGHVSFGNQRHLLTGFQSRGVVTGVRMGTLAKVQLAALNGSSIVGWNNLLGLRESGHRVLAANAAFDVVPGKPGVIQVEASVMHGRLLPQGGFSQGVVNDSEKSEGGALQLSAALPSQRVRLEAGFARSRFTNPFDPTLAQGETIVPVEPVTRNARYLDMNVALLRSASTNLALVFRHERVDPLYRSVATSVQADILQDAFEMQASIGPVALRATHARGHDNLDRIGTILSTQTRSSSANVDLPAALLFGKGAPAWLPVLSYGIMQLHQFGDSVPTAGGFPDSFVPDQVSVNGTVGAQLQGSAWRMALRYNRSTQDNRQVGREDADFLNRSGTLSLGLTPLRSLELGADLAVEVAESHERDQENTTRRLGTTLVWQMLSASTLSGSLSTTHTTDQPRTMDQQSTDLRLELVQRLNVFGSGSTRAPGQLFLRYSRIFGEQAAPGALGFSQRNWMLNTGASLTLF